MIAVLALHSGSSTYAQQGTVRPKPPGAPGAFFGPDAYPPSAIRLGEEGRVVMKLGVDANGRVVACDIATSSGSTSLDVQSCRIARARIVFQPARDANGRPIASDCVLPVRWQLPPGAAGAVELESKPPLRFELAVEATLDASGTVIACLTLASQPAPGAFNGCGAFPIGVKIDRGYKRAGKPVGVKIVQRFSREVIPDP